jgi:hypothetical protein
MNFILIDTFPEDVLPPYKQLIITPSLSVCQFVGTLN